MKLSTIVITALLVANLAFGVRILTAMADITPAPAAKFRQE